MWSIELHTKLFEYYEMKILSLLFPLGSLFPHSMTFSMFPSTCNLPKQCFFWLTTRVRALVPQLVWISDANTWTYVDIIMALFATQNLPVWLWITMMVTLTNVIMSSLVQHVQPLAPKIPSGQLPIFFPESRRLLSFEPKGFFHLSD